MEIFGIGPLELILILLIALIVLGPQDTVRTGRNVGRAVRRFFSSEEWRTMLQATKEIRSIPDKLMEETGLDHPEEIFPSEEEIRKEAGLDDLERDMSLWKADLSSMSKGTANTGTGVGAPAQEQSNRILPPSLAAPSIPTTQQEIRKESGLQDLEKELSEWKADISAWGNSPVIIPIPAAETAVPAEASSTEEASSATPPSTQEPPKTGQPSAPSSTEPSTPPDQDPK